jgi:hypothetical protein
MHPLLSCIDATEDDTFSFGRSQLEQVDLSQRLSDLRSGALTDLERPLPKGARKAPLVEKGKGGIAGVTVGGKASMLPADILSLTKDSSKRVGVFEMALTELIPLLDPNRTGTVRPENFIPLMFWLGVARRRKAALATIEEACGPGNISVSLLHAICEDMDVKVRLVEGLKHVIRRDSLDPLCEYVTNPAKIRSWFDSMRRDVLGRVDINELMNFFATKEVIKDQLSLFRFLRHEMRRRARINGYEAEASGSLGMKEFSCLITTCVFSWCLRKTLGLIMPSDIERPINGLGGHDTQLALKWAHLQRKITVSMLVNHRFWGREGRTVLPVISEHSCKEDLTPEQWLLLFQRVRAQGMKSILPVGDEVNDPNFLRNRTQHLLEEV